MKLARDELLRRFHERDAGHDGTFVVGVVTTGIYCLPSCRARKPRDRNVVFFDDEAGARSAGLRACKRCRPDHFYRQHDPDRERVARLAARVRSDARAFADAKSLAAEAGYGSTKLNQLFRRHYHTTPAGYLQRAKLAEAARELIRTKRRVLDVALDAGFESPSAFHESFHRWSGMAPGAYRRLGEHTEFSLDLPADFRRDDVFGLFGRDPQGRTERTNGRSACKALLLAGRPARLELGFGPRRVRVRVHGHRSPRGPRSPRGLDRDAMVEAHAAAVRMLGLRCEPAPFERKVARTRGLGRLVRGRRGLRIPLTADPFEGLVWVIVGQQVNVRFAATCRDALIELCGEPAGEGFTAHPTPAAVARLDYAELRARQFSRGKAEYLIDVAREAASGGLDLERLGDEPASRIEGRLREVRGLGPWSTQYLLMRSYGLDDCVPVGDVALAEALQRFFGLDERPDGARTLELMEPFAPHRSLATFHLWKSLGDET